MSTARSPEERRHGRRGNPLADLCLVLEAARQNAALGNLVLADQQGFLIAGAGRYDECEELGARAAQSQRDAAYDRSTPAAPNVAQLTWTSHFDRGEAVVPRAAEETRPSSIWRFELLGSEVLLCADPGALEPSLVEQVKAQCARVLSPRPAVLATASV